MKLKIVGALLCLTGAAVVSFFPLPGNLIGLPIALIGAIMVIAFSGGQNWRKLQ